MQLAARLLVLCVVSVAGQGTNSAVLGAICSKSKAELAAIVQAFQERKNEKIDVPEDPTWEDLARTMFRLAQEEVPGRTEPVTPWPEDGCASAPKPAPKPAATPSSQRKPAPTQYEKMAEMLFKANDKDKDGRLTREELSKMVEATNEQARAKGEREVDFFKAVDADADGFASKEEITSYFKAEMDKGAASSSSSSSSGSGSGGGSGKGGTTTKAKPTTASAATQKGGVPNAADLHKAMFGKLDANNDGKLSREEMREIIDKTNQQASNQQSGETGEDFFKSLDADGDGEVDMEEAKAFFEAATAMVGGGTPKGKAAGKDEV